MIWSVTGRTNSTAWPSKMASGMANKHEFEMDNPEQMELISEEGRDHGKAIRSLKHRLAKTGSGILHPDRTAPT